MVDRGIAVLAGLAGLAHGGILAFQPEVTLDAITKSSAERLKASDVAMQATLPHLGVSIALLHVAILLSAITFRARERGVLLLIACVYNAFGLVKHYEFWQGAGGQRPAWLPDDDAFFFPVYLMAGTALLTLFGAAKAFHSVENAGPATSGKTKRS
jgi:hypothetical protein